MLFLDMVCVTVNFPAHPKRKWTSRGFSAYKNLCPGRKKRGTEEVNRETQEAKTKCDATETYGLLQWQRRKKTKKQKQKKSSFWDDVYYLIGHDSLLGDISSGPLLGAAGERERVTSSLVQH